MNKIIAVIILLTPLFIAFAQEKNETPEYTLVAEGLAFPEGPAWNGEMLLVSNCYSDWILRVKDGITDTFVVKPTSPFDFGKTNGLTFYKDGSLYACDYGKGAILKFQPDGTCETVAEDYEGKKFNRPNDLAFDSRGNLWFTDPHKYHPDTLDGAIYQIDTDGKVRQMYYGLGFCNGIALNAEETKLYVCESAMHRVLTFAINKDGSLSEPEVFAEMPGGDPDGMAFDIEGNLYVAHFGGKAIWKFNKSGLLLQKIETPGTKPSNIEFGGKDLKTLYITEDEHNALYKIEMKTPGLPLFSAP